MTRKEHPYRRIAQGIRLIADALDDLSYLDILDKPEKAAVSRVRVKDDPPSKRETIGPTWRPSAKPRDGKRSKVSPYNTVRMVIATIQEPFTAGAVVRAVGAMLKGVSISEASIRAYVSTMKRNGELVESGKVQEGRFKLKTYKKGPKWEHGG